MADEISIWTTKEIILAVLGTGIVSGSASFMVDYFRGKSSRKRDRIYLCIRIATTLEAYAIKCAELLDASDAYYGQTKTPLRITLPEAPIYPADVHWQSVDPRIVYRIMTFLNECEAQAADARFVDNFEGNPFGAEDAVKTTGKKAYELANVLRAIASLQPPDFGNVLKPLFR